MCTTPEGTGTFGRVRLVRHLDNGKYYALKISKKASIIRMKQVGPLRSLVLTSQAPTVYISLLFVVVLYVVSRRRYIDLYVDPYDSLFVLCTQTAAVQAIYTAVHTEHTGMLGSTGYGRVD